MYTYQVFYCYILCACKLANKGSIIQYSSSVCKDHGGQGFLAPPQKQLNIYFVRSRQYRLGLTKVSSDHS